MKINEYLYPHPVLGIGGDYKEVPESIYTINYEDQEGYYSFKFELLGLSLDFEDLLKMGFLKLICEVNCTYTLYRKVFSTNELLLTFKISENELKDRVELQLMLIAAQDIENFKSPNFSEDLKEFSFQIENGDVLGILKSFTIDVDAAGLALADFVKITENTIDEFTRYDLDKNSLVIKLPENQIASLRLLRNNPYFENILISTIIIPALIHALHYLNEDNEDSYGEKAWFKALKEKCENIVGMPYPDDQGDISKIIDIILVRPNERLFKELENLHS